jgi:hypothetical protein
MGEREKMNSIRNLGVKTTIPSFAEQVVSRGECHQIDHRIPISLFPLQSAMTRQKVARHQFLSEAPRSLFQFQSGDFEFADRGLRLILSVQPQVPHP